MPLVVLVLACFLAAPLAAQDWNSPQALDLVRRGVARRQAVEADPTLQSYRSRAHGFVFFLAQVGKGLTDPPRLVKADELEVEVYWQAPGRSKQLIRGWRDGRWLPTDINYHRDHLGVVTNNYGDRIRIGEGDEVRDAIHPLSPGGLDVYDFALEDSLAVTAGAQTVRVYEMAVRPRSFDRALVVGTLYLDVASAEVVRFRFSFTPASYLDPELEDISVVLENSLYEGRYWLPDRQEIEIRRRATWLDFPTRGIIRGRWEIGPYELNAALPPGLMAGPAIGGLRRPAPEARHWDQSLEASIRGVADPINQQDMASLRAQVEEIAGDRTLNAIRGARPAAGSVSDLVHVNRVQGLTLGFGAAFMAPDRRLELRPVVGYGTSDGRMTGSLTASVGAGALTIFGTGARSVRDVSDFRIIAPIVNSVTAQEAGEDYGDYVLLESGSIGLRRRFGGRTTAGLELGVEESKSMAVAASPAHGDYRPNPELGTGTIRLARLSLDRAGGGIAVASDLHGRLTLEGGVGAAEYVRGALDAVWQLPTASGELRTRWYAAVGTDELPAYRSFVFGGRGTLVGEPFRAYGGRTTTLGHAEWRFRLPVPAIPLGSLASTGRSLTLAPFVAAGWSDRPIPGTPWAASDGVRPVAGLAIEWFLGLLRVEGGVGLRDGTFGLTLDVSRDWWEVL
ncbi:MAG TPA: hypothetical protein VFO06_01540 [Gemmatimonadales bacterium]|nr:hypothetical protein [Gemmatimonadales bacterium]